MPSKEQTKDKRVGLWTCSATDQRQSINNTNHDSHLAMPVLRARRQEVLPSTLAVTHSSTGYASVCADQQEKLVSSIKNLARQP